jgi:Tfp pilus assembly protein PilO
MSTQVKERVSKIETRRPHLASQRLRLSLVEITAALVVLAFALVVLYFYFTSLKPEQDKLAQIEQQYEKQRKVLSDLANPDDKPTITNTIVEALNSLAVFKSHHLRPRAQGQRALIDEVNALVKKHNARLTSGLEMSVENTGLEVEKKASSSKNVEESLNVFPKLNISFTIAGQYPNLRAFINDLEHNKQFLVINTITLTSLEQTDSETGKRTAAPASGLSLTVNLSAYFQP